MALVNVSQAKVQARANIHPGPSLDSRYAKVQVQAQTQDIP